MTDEERKQYDEERAAVREKRKRRRRRPSEEEAALTAPQCVVIDLEFGDLMEEKEKKSMAYQLGICYSANCKAVVPAQIHVTGLGSGMGGVVRKVCSGVEHWAVHMSDETYLESPALAERKTNLVYLTADSEHELEDSRMTRCTSSGASWTGTGTRT